MSLDEPDTTAPADAINGFGDLYPRQVSTRKTVVLSLRNDEPTAYTVDCLDMTCDCPDAQFNKGDPEICDHLAVTLYQESVHLDVDEALMTDLQRVLHDIEESARKVDETAAVLEDDLVDLRTTEAAQTAETTATESDREPVDRLADTLRDAGHNPDSVDMWVDDDLGSLQFEPDDMSQDEFDAFGDWCRSTDGVNWDRDEYRNYIKSDDFEEVLVA
jgi:hypothetical protein